ncbi:MAG: hypothetical protein A2W90_21770 [Bacteroidetes bacterium GWF2_42_66]|nr:MAG: hypothetical protein A2W92_04585 [Bacteroidetes bacterium GWA2_42_15]OFY03278.1 MAG: hypothetical protein A2W89_19090 [Bacteroidetes bacterium GWE2_42_39]OFY45672.1 MAG: hypothetical protein A2W90_21770 [Bacteroidetes bacterium GWF2_42_66]HBL77343.1 hypothetical protein [Prolixibacteraceae bacterium]HCU62501.1 hypothetical protein [Prolixibacteraceae bacterium]
MLANVFLVIIPFVIVFFILPVQNVKKTTEQQCVPDSVITEVPHIHSIGISEFQPQENDSDVIWYDDFNQERKYLESSGEIDYSESFSKDGGSMKAGFKKGDVEGEGGRKLAFGDFPNGSMVVKKGKHFDEVYWRIYVKHQYGWEGAPFKMSRATSIVSEKWQQAMIAHVWSGKDNSLTLDPASGVYGQSDSIITNGYNDFKNLKWLGNNPCSTFQISSGTESGYWVLVEASAKLNTPGKSDGSCRLWIDGRLEAERTNLNLKGSYAKHGINAVFLESYWNGGACKTEGRWYDNFVVSQKPIGPVACPVNPVLYKTPYHGLGKMETWEVELATDFSGSNTVYKSKSMGTNDSITINANFGTFTGSLKGKFHLIAGYTYFCRVRQKCSDGLWSDWSRWHQPFNVAEN